MKIRKLMVFGSCALLSILAVEGASDGKLVIVLAGDSTVAKAPADNAVRGWGQMLPAALRTTVTVKNLAYGGASTRTFLETRHEQWMRKLEAKPEVVLIQFGHNDSHAPSEPESTDADTEFRKNIELLAREAGAAGARVVLVTPPHRRRFDADGKMKREELARYAEVIREVGKTQNLPVIDLHSWTGQFFEERGDAGSGDLTVSEEDRTHFTEKGASLLAAQVAAELAVAVPELKLELIAKESR